MNRESYERDDNVIYQGIGRNREQCRRAGPVYLVAGTGDAASTRYIDWIKFFRCRA
jgi:hypothetical protein